VPPADVETLGQQVLEFTPFDDRQAIVARGERLTLRADPGRGDENASGRPLLLYYAGEGTDRLRRHALGVALGLDDVLRLMDHVGLVIGDRVDALVPRRLIFTVMPIASKSCRTRFSNRYQSIFRRSWRESIPARASIGSVNRYFA
jgi:hypothetical protein